MRWQGRRASTNVEAHQGLSPKTMVGGGIGSEVILLLVHFLGGDPGRLQTLGVDTGGQQTGGYGEPAEQKALTKFVSVVLAENGDFWSALSRRSVPEHGSLKPLPYHDGKGRR
jgi:uncharacterized protein